MKAAAEVGAEEAEEEEAVGAVGAEEEVVVGAVAGVGVAEVKQTRRRRRRLHHKLRPYQSPKPLPVHWRRFAF